MSAPVTSRDTIAFAFVKPNRLRIISRDSTGISITTFDARTFLLIDTSVIPDVDYATYDALGHQWSATGLRLSCGTKRWTLNSPVTELTALDQGWILITTASNRWAARCELDTLAVIPQRESSQ